MEVFITLGRRSDCRVHLVFSVWAFCGVKPHKKCPQFFLKFWIKILSKKSKILIFNFGSKNCADECILVSGVR